VVAALQRMADDDFELVANELDSWAGGTPNEQRVAVAALCVPRLLGSPAAASRGLALLDRVSGSFDSESDGADGLLKTLGKGWSVAVAAHPEEGMPMFRSLADSDDPDRLRIARASAGKSRLRKLLAEEVADG
jgi:hypothetical protein